MVSVPPQGRRSSGRMGRMRHEHVPGDGVEVAAEVGHDRDDAAKGLPRVGAAVEQQPASHGRRGGPVPRWRRWRPRGGHGRAPAPGAEVQNVSVVEEDALRGAASKDERALAGAAAAAAAAACSPCFRLRRSRHQRRAVREPRPRRRAAPVRVPRPPPGSGLQIQEPRVVERAAVARGAAKDDDRVGAAGAEKGGVAVPRARGALGGVRGDVELDPGVVGVLRVDERERRGRGRDRGRRRRSAVACSSSPSSPAAAAPFARRRRGRRAVQRPGPQQPHLAGDFFPGAAVEQEAVLADGGQRRAGDCRGAAADATAAALFASPAAPRGRRKQPPLRPCRLRRLHRRRPRVGDCVGPQGPPGAPPDVELVRAPQEPSPLPAAEDKDAAAAARPLRRGGAE